MYKLTFLVGLAMSFFTFWTLNHHVPPRGLGEESPFIDEIVIYGEERHHSVASKDSMQRNEKQVDGTVKTVVVY
jgi:hypothetical protein